MSVSWPQAYLLASGTWLLELLDCLGDSDHQGQSQLLEGRDKDGGRLSWASLLTTLPNPPPPNTPLSLIHI